MYEWILGPIPGGVKFSVERWINFTFRETIISKRNVNTDTDCYHNNKNKIIY